jgi:hypothetical protein
VEFRLTLAFALHINALEISSHVSWAAKKKFPKIKFNEALCGCSLLLCGQRLRWHHEEQHFIFSPQKYL